MYIKWTENLKTEEEKQRFLNTLKSSQSVLERLQEIIKQQKSVIESSETDIETYDTPNWSSKQAHLNGYRNALNYINKLIDLDHQKGINFDPKFTQRK